MNIDGLTKEQQEELIRVAEKMRAENDDKYIAQLTELVNKVSGKNLIKNEVAAMSVKDLFNILGKKFKIKIAVEEV